MLEIAICGIKVDEIDKTVVSLNDRASLRCL